METQNDIISCFYLALTWTLPGLLLFAVGERKTRPRGDRRSIEMTLHMQQTFEAAIMTQLYPRSQIDIFVEVSQIDGIEILAVKA